jgi:hypothetical protein
MTIDTPPTTAAARADLTKRHSIRPSRQIPLWVAILVAAIIAVVAAVSGTDHHPTHPPTTGTQLVLNANAREGRVATTPVLEPNANTREDRVATPSVVLPNANARESRVATDR